MTGKVQQQNIEEKTIEDFLFFLVHFKEAFDSLKSESDKEICKVTNNTVHQSLRSFFIYMYFMCNLRNG